MRNVLWFLRLFSLVRLASVVPTWLVLDRTGDLSGGLIWVGVLTVAGTVFVWFPLPVGFLRRVGLDERLSSRARIAGAIFLMITLQVLELTITSSPSLWQVTWDQLSTRNWIAFFSWRSESYFYLLIPVVLAGWAFERRGALWAAAWAIGLYLLGGLWLLTHEGALPFGYLTTLPPKIILLLVVPLLVAYLTTKQRREHQELVYANAQLKHQTMLAEQLGISRERNRLARELHDTLAHTLSGLSVQLQVVDLLFDEDQAAARETMRSAREVARDGLGAARRAIAALRATPLEDLGLVEASRQYLLEMGERLALRTVWDIKGYYTDLSPAIAQTVYRVLVEALRNIERHAAAQNVTVCLRREAGVVLLIVSDDGQGFDVQRARAQAEHFGLRTMAERAGLMGGDLTVESHRGAGTTVRMEIWE